MDLKIRFFLQSNYAENARYNRRGQIKSEQIHKGHSDHSGTLLRWNSVGVQYLNFYRHRITWDLQGSNDKTKRTFVENVGYFWSKQISVKKGMDSDQEKQIKSQRYKASTCKVGIQA